MLECNEAFENTELSPWNAIAQQRPPHEGAVNSQKPNGGGRLLVG